MPFCNFPDCKQPDGHSGPCSHTISEETFDSGAVRSALDDVRYDLISPFGLQRLATRYDIGAKHFEGNNWRKGMPFSALINHILNHLTTYLAGDRKDDHLAAAAWGLFAMMEQEETNPKMNDLYDFGEVELEPAFSVKLSARSVRGRLHDLD